MKITAYEVREDETEIMKKLADKLGIDELVTTAEPLTLDTAHLAKGAAVIKNLSGFGCKILAHSRHEDENVKKYATYVDMDTIYSECDIISFHTPLNDATYHMVNKRTIAKMKKGVILINCARGELMNINDITKGIEDEQIGALALDVFENENGIYHHDRKTDIIKNKDMAYLRQFPNVIMTQHMAFYTEQAVVSMVHCGLESLVAFAENKEYRCQLQ